MVAKSPDEARAQNAAALAARASGSASANNAAKAAAAKTAAAKKAAEKKKLLDLKKKAEAQIKKNQARIAELEKGDADAKAQADALRAETAAAQAETDAAVDEIKNPPAPIVNPLDPVEPVDPYDVNPGSSGFTDSNKTVTYARNTFANTIALLVGEKEASEPWVNELYDLAQGFINTGSTVEEAQNLALREAKKLGKASKFVQRFDAIFKLQDRLNAGEAVQVPSIADYVKSEQQLGDVFRAVGLGELATQEIAGKILGDANKSVAEASSIIENVFSAIDNAPGALGEDLKRILNKGVDRVSIAKALLTGKEGALELTKKVRSIEQYSAAKSQGVNIDLAMGAELAAGGADYGTSLGKFGTVKRLERGQMLGNMSGIDLTQQESINAVFSQDVRAQDKIAKIEEEEKNRFSGRSGRLASQNRSTAGLI